LVLFDSHFGYLFIHFIVSSVDLEDADGRLADNRGIDRIDFDFTKLSRTGATTTFLQTAMNATTTSLRIEARPPIRILLRQVLTLVLILAFGRESTPVTVLALRDSSARLATLFCHEHNLVTTILQIDDTRLKPERLDCFDIAVTLALSLTEHSLHHGRDVLLLFMWLFGWGVATGRISSSGEYVAFLNNRRIDRIVVVIKDELVELIIVHEKVLMRGTSAVSLILDLILVCYGVKINSFFSALLYMSCHQVV